MYSSVAHKWAPKSENRLAAINISCLTALRHISLLTELVHFQLGSPL